MFLNAGNPIVWCCLVCSLVPSLIAASPSIIDQSDDIEAVAKLVCDTTRGTAHQLGRISTIQKLLDFLDNESQEKRAEFSACRYKYMESLVKLNYLFTTANEDVCGDEKLRLIEHYHRQFVSRVAVEKSAPKAPKVANLLFMQYAKRVSSVCEQQAVKVLKQSWIEIRPEEQAKLDKMKLYIASLGMSDLSRDYDSIYLFWNMLDLLPLERNEKISRYLAKGGQTRVNVRMRDVRPMQGLQALCRYKFSPLYSQSILPVLRLIDLGYYPDGKQLIEGIKHDSYTTSMFIQTQICETLKRVKAFPDDTLEGDMIVAVPLEDAAKLPTPPELPDIETIAEKHATELSSLVGLDQLLDNEEALKDVEMVKQAVKSRSKVMNRVLKTLLGNLKGKFKSKVKNLYLGERNRKSQELQEALDMSSIESHEIKVFNEEEDEGESVEEERVRVKHGGGGGGGFKRKLKAFGNQVLSVIFVTLVGMYMVALLCIKIAILLVPTILAWYMHDVLKLKDNGFVKGVFWSWGAGWDLTDPLNRKHQQVRP